MNQKKIKELISQIKKDKYIVKKLFDGKIWFFGFVNSKIIGEDIKNDIKGINFLLFGLKDGLFLGKNMTHYLDC